MINWEILSQNENLISEMTATGIDETVSRILVNRGCRSATEAAEFLAAPTRNLFSSALLPDIDAAAEKINDAVLLRRKITVYGDYDVDGVTSVSLLFRYLRSLGADVSFYIPDRREEGYGLSFAALDAIKADGTSLVVTVDTGTTAVEEVEYAKEIGLDVVVTDHHECSETLPDCPVVNPKRADSDYPFSFLAGVGVVFKLIAFLSGASDEELFENYGLAAAIGTVADIMPLVSENRTIVSRGLAAYSAKKDMGVAALLSASQTARLDASSVAFRIAPRLNAVGRMSSANTAVELLLCENAERAEKLASFLCEKNEERQSTEKRIFNAVEKRLDGEEKHNIIVEGGEDWHNGVIGIVASRLAEKYRRPTILFTFDGENAKGSARSIPGFGIYNAVFACKDRLRKFGGHEMAAGLSLKREDFDAFKKEICEYADKNVDETVFCRRVVSDCVISSENISLSTCKKLSALEPFGAGNQTPVFTAERLTVLAVTGVSENKHCRITLACEDGTEFDAMYFSVRPTLLPLRRGDKVDVAFTMSVNEFRGRESLSVILKAMRFCEKPDCDVAAPFGKITRADVAAVYTFLRKSAENGTLEISPLGLYRALSVRNAEMTYSKMAAALKITEELGLLTVAERETCGVSEDFAFSIKFNESTEKTSLDKSETYLKYSV